MANLLSIAEQVWLQLTPKGTDEAKITREEVVAAAKNEYAYQFWLKWKNEKGQEGVFEVPSYLLTEKEFDVVEDEIDMKDEKIMRALEEQDKWLQNVGGLACECVYVKSTVNREQLLCDDDSLDDDMRTFYVVGKKVKFPRGTHSDKLPVIFANMGENVPGELEVDDTIGGVVRRSLLDLFLGKVGPEDKTNNSNPNN